jgi:uncharacterized OsmC-like protein
MDAEGIRQAIEQVGAYLVEHPEEGRGRDRPATAVMEDGLRCRVEDADGATVVTDMSTKLGGGGTAPSPGWLARAALASCDATAIAIRAAEVGLPLERIEVSVESESDMRGILAGADDDVPAGPSVYRSRIRLAPGPGVSAEQLRDIVEWAERRSAVGDALRRAIPIETEIEVTDAQTIAS